MIYHVITPFSRPQNISALVKHLRPLGVTWHPLIHKAMCFPQQLWIRPMFTPYPPETEENGSCCYHKVNTFIEAGLIDEDYYCVLCDDDLYELDFFDNIQRHTGDVIICSMHWLNGRELIAAPQNMRQGQVGFEQLIIKGKVLKRYRYKMDCQADGQLIETVCKENPVDYAPEAWVLFNALQKLEERKNMTKSEPTESICLEDIRHALNSEKHGTDRVMIVIANRLNAKLNLLGINVRWINRLDATENRHGYIGHYSIEFTPPPPPETARPTSPPSSRHQEAAAPALMQPQP